MITYNLSGDCIDLLKDHMTETLDIYTDDKGVQKLLVNGVKSKATYHGKDSTLMKDLRTSYGESPATQQLVQFLVEAIRNDVVKKTFTLDAQLERAPDF